MTKQNFILQIAVAAPVRFALDYLPPKDYNGKLMPGMRVRIPFRRNETIGILLGIKTHSEIDSKRLKHAITIIDTQPVIPANLLSLIHWASEYYHYPIGEVTNQILPTLIRQGRALAHHVTQTNYHRKENPHLLSTEQNIVVTEILQKTDEYHAFLLHGVTGSGKTEIYFHVIEQILSKQKQILVLVPEIALTPQTLNRFKARFDKSIVTLHSGLTDRERFDNWIAASNEQASIIIGTRSAVFTPIPKLGIIIIDEEHDSSYKQQDGFRYSARDLAVMRASKENIPIILGSATPSLETYYNAKLQRYHYLHLSERAGIANLPHFNVIDIRNHRLDHGLSKPLIKTIHKHIEQGKQVLLFLNRRGYAPNLICHQCGWSAKCKRCDTNLILHQNPPRLHCHHCDSTRPVETQCPECHGKELIPLGLGTQRIETALKKHFPSIGISRIDRDSVRKKGALQEKLDDILSGKNQILIGTQMLAKGHHFPNVSMVAILDVDSGFFSADIRASERLGQLLIQVAGRAGREAETGEVWLQTRHPDHPLLLKLLVEGYTAFIETLLLERKQLGF
ncbi:MAG: primosomal protein N', partial [Gammaproteobacteria bacterium]